MTLIKPYKGVMPKIHPDAWIAENAVIIGDVEIGPDSSIWYGCVLRGDLNPIRVGKKTNIQDGTVVHVESMQGPCLIGDQVTIGHNATVHGCTVEDGVMIGIGAIVLSYAKLGQESLVAAGAVVKEGQVVPERMIVAGVPAKERNPVSEKMLTRMQLSAEHYVELAKVYKSELV